MQAHTDIVATGWVARLPRSWLPYLLLARVDRPIGVWLLFLPVMIGLWIWETTWPLLVRLVLVIGIAGWNLLIFLPRAAQTVR